MGGNCGYGPALDRKSVGRQRIPERIIIAIMSTCHRRELHPSGAVRKVFIQIGHVTGPSDDV